MISQISTLTSLAHAPRLMKLLFTYSHMCDNRWNNINIPESSRLYICSSPFFSFCQSPHKFSFHISREDITTLRAYNSFLCYAKILQKCYWKARTEEDGKKLKHKWRLGAGAAEPCREYDLDGSARDVIVRVNDALWGSNSSCCAVYIEPLNSIQQSPQSSLTLQPQ